MLSKFDDKFQYENSADCVKDLKARYRRTHSDEKEGLHYQFNESCVADSSGFLKVERLEENPLAPNIQTETVLIEDNRVVAHRTDETPPEGVELWHWLD